MKILVFPTTCDGAREFVAEAKRFGCDVYGSASVPDPHAGDYLEWQKLPFVTEPGFKASLHDVLKRTGCTKIFTSNFAVRSFLDRHPEAIPTGVHLFGEGPIARQTAYVKGAWQGTAERLERIRGFAAGEQPYQPSFVVSLLDRFRQICGEADEERVLGLCGAFASAPSGDVVEIGSLFGKTAFVLSRLAAFHAVGRTVCVDPWSAAAAVQRDSPEHIQALPAAWDMEAIFEGFLIAMGAEVGWVHLRNTSDAAFAGYTGSISVLLIDGNHDEAQVRRDWRNWGSRLVPGGWVVFDDYEWAHGDGPRKVGDEAAAELGARVMRTFVAGGALFLKVA